MKKALFLAIASVVLASCGGNAPAEDAAKADSTAVAVDTTALAVDSAAVAADTAAVATTTVK
jgi:uncharacterized protein YcfL